MRVTYVFPILVASVALLTACSQEPQEKLKTLEPSEASTNSSTPANSQRDEQIREGLDRLRAGMSKGEVAKLLGQPDERHPLYEPRVKHAAQIGETWWYRSATEIAADGQVFRVSFDLDGLVTQTDHWPTEEGS